LNYKLVNVNSPLTRRSTCFWDFETICDISWLIVLILIGFGSCNPIPPSEATTNIPDPKFQWQISTPEAMGMSTKMLEDLQQDLERRGTKKLLIIKNDQVIYQWFAKGFEDSVKTHYTASMAKALVGGMSLLVALDDGLLSPDMPVCTLVPEWKNDPQKSKITIRQLATHTSGLDDAEVSSEIQQQLKAKGIGTHMELPGWKGQFWRQEPDPFSVSRDSAKVLFTPGSHFSYSNPGVAMLTYAVTASLGNSAYSDIRSLLQERIYHPIGIGEKEIAIGYGKKYQEKGLALVPSWGGGSSTANAVARIGRLMLQGGNWQGSQLVNQSTVEKVLAYAKTAIPSNQPELVADTGSLRNSKNSYPATTMGWYTNFDKIWKYIPADAFAAAGAGHQLLLVVPSLDLIVVRFGDDLSGDRDDGFWSDAEKYLFNPVMDAIVEPPYPQSKSVLDCQFAAESETLRLAEGSDNWPTTWADDGHIYTSYGDGWGFEPKTDIKLSLGLSRIEGVPPDIKGINIRTSSGERVGQGKYGAKASGMLFVEGVLYMLVRNTGNAQLAWSYDHGKTWSWADWTFNESFGCPTFLNFGKNYSNARDNYIYIYSPDRPDAYTSADNMVLARVPKESLVDWQSYQYFSGVDKKQLPQWTDDIRKRQPVFSNPGKCYRSGISYNSGLNKYVWTQIIPLATSEQGPRFSGGLGIFMADEPWGPWETVFYQRTWDMGPGETANIPTKWISDDGYSFYLVFSGDDYFSVRQGRFQE